MSILDARQIVRAAGGATAVARAAADWRHPVTLSSVYKWTVNGIPEAHWPLIMRLAPDVTPAMLHTANELARALDACAA